MHIFMTGATGLIGRATILRLMRDGHEVTAWVRNPERARSVLGSAASLVGVHEGDEALREAVGRADAVINLAGEPILGRMRWTRRRRAALEDSRIGVTQKLVAAIRAAERPPNVLISASAVGIYGDRGDRPLDERSEPGAGFAADLCRRWEASAMRAASLRTRVATLRIGVVLGAGGGMMERLLPVFRAGFGGPLGSGAQYLPWIHIVDMVEVIARALTDGDMSGPINAVAPASDTSRDLARALGHELGRPAALRVPASALRLAMGEAAGVVLASQNVVPEALEKLGFRFQHPSLRSALHDILDDGCHFEPVTDVPQVSYLERNRPRYLLRQTTAIEAPISQVFEFFSKAENLSLITPPSLSFNILTPTPIPMASGTVIDYRIQMGPLPMRWRTVIEDWEPGRRFTDAQHRGPYRAWWHEHNFAVDLVIPPPGRLGGSAKPVERTLMEDLVFYAPPLGPLGRVANRLFVEQKLREIFGYRRAAIALRFNCARSQEAGSRAA